MVCEGTLSRRYQMLSEESLSLQEQLWQTSAPGEIPAVQRAAVQETSVGTGRRKLFIG